MKKIIALLVVFSVTIIGFSQVENFRFKDYLKNKPNEITTFCIPNNASNRLLLENEKIKVKFQSDNWLFISATPEWIYQQKTNGKLDQFYFEFAPPVALSDSSRFYHHVDEVHAGTNGLGNAYTGANILIGFVDTGSDWLHEDLRDNNGKTRILRYWDQTASVSSNTPQPYNYGRLWDSTAINAGLCTAVPSGVHGTTVVGKACGNARACGENKGMAPDSKIVMVQTNFNAANWTLTVADACDYIFKYADSLGIPAVINLSVGTYFGSHDGNDPASEYMEQLIDEHGGRIIVSAAGNAGNKGKFHVHGTAQNDTTFVWFLNNPSSALGANTIYFDLWTDPSDASTIDFAIGADKPSPNYGYRGRTNFYNMNAIAGNIIYDTIYNDNQNRIATVEIYPELIDGAFHMEVYLSHVDSTSYYYRFMTKGSGQYDAWSGAWQGVNDMVTTLPNATVVPEIVKYQMPDTLQSIVSSWNCSEKVISVGNFKNRAHHTDKNGNLYTPSTASTPVGKISINSSRGPSRHNVVKPDVAATGDFGLSAAPLSYLSNPANNSAIDINGFHTRMTGTSIASPVVAGIAALYLEKCPTATYENFKTDLLATSYQDQYTGNSPNFTYGYGKPHALNLLLGNNMASITGSPVVCGQPTVLGTSVSSGIDSIVWDNGNVNLNYTATNIDTVSAIVYYGSGCHVNTDTAYVVYNQLDSITGNTGICTDPITLNAYYTGDLDSLVWSTGSTNNSTSINAPGNYTVNLYFSSGCILPSGTINVPQNTILPAPVISYANGILNSDLQPNYQWVYDGNNITGETSQSLVLPSGQYGTYSVYVISDDGCISTSSDFQSANGINTLSNDLIRISPNPTSDLFKIESETFIYTLKIHDNQGKLVIEKQVNNNAVSIVNLSPGTYTLEATTELGTFHSKIIKM